MEEVPRHEADRQTDEQGLLSDTIAVERLNPALDRIYEQIERVQVELPKTEEVLHKVVEAAEHNQAIEKLFEMRHEVKDQSSVRSDGSDDFGGSKVRQTYQLQQAPPMIAVRTGHKLAHILPARNSLYGQAIRYGIVTAALAMALAVILVSLFT